MPNNCNVDSSALSNPYQEDVHRYAAEHNFEELKKLLDTNLTLAANINETENENPLMRAIRFSSLPKNQSSRYLHLFMDYSSELVQNRISCIDLLMQSRDAVCYNNANKCKNIRNNVRSPLGEAIDALDLETAIKLIKSGAPIIYGGNTPNTQLLSRLFCSASYIMNSMENPQKLKEILGKDVTVEEIKSVESKLKKNMVELIDVMLKKNRIAIFSKCVDLYDADSFQMILSSWPFSIHCCEFIIETLTSLMEPDDVDWEHKNENNDTVWTLALQVSIKYNCNNTNLLWLLYKAGAGKALLSVTHVDLGRNTFVEHRGIFESVYPRTDRTPLDYAHGLLDAIHYYIHLLEEDIHKKQVSLHLLEESHKCVTSIVWSLNDTNLEFKLLERGFTLSDPDTQLLGFDFKNLLLQMPEEKDKHLLVLNCTEAFKSALEGYPVLDFPYSCISAFIHNFRKLMSNEDDKVHILCFAEPRRQNFFKSLIINDDPSTIVLDFVATLEECMSKCCEGLKTEIKLQKERISAQEAAKSRAEEQLKVMHTLIEQEKQKGLAPSTVFEGASASEECQAVFTRL